MTERGRKERPYNGALSVAAAWTRTAPRNSPGRWSVDGDGLCVGTRMREGAPLHEVRTCPRIDLDRSTPMD